MRFQYGQAAAQVLDHYFPSGAVPARPGHLVLVHGGGWTSGDPQDGIMPFWATTAAALGYTATSVGYRLAEPGVDWSVQVQDIIEGIAYARTTLGATGRIDVLGESAGAHLATMAALGGTCIEPVAGLIALYGAHDLQALDSDCPTHKWSTDPATAACLRACLGGVLPWENPVRAALGSPDYLVQVMTSVVPRVLLIHSTEDPLIGAEQSRRLMRVLTGRAGVSVTLFEIPGSEHSGARFQTPPVSDVILSFLARA